MATKKDDKILKDAEEQNIPVFVLSAKDSTSIATLNHYFDLCSRMECNEEHLTGISSRISEFKAYQVENPDMIKLPD